MSPYWKPLCIPLDTYSTQSKQNLQKTHGLVTRKSSWTFNNSCESGYSTWEETTAKRNHNQIKNKRNQRNLGLWDHRVMLLCCCRSCWKRRSWRSSVLYLVSERDACWLLCCVLLGLVFFMVHFFFILSIDLHPVERDQWQGAINPKKTRVEISSIFLIF